MNNEVAFIGQTNKDMRNYWDMARALLGGTYAMRERGET